MFAHVLFQEENREVNLCRPGLLSRSFKVTNVQLVKRQSEAKGSIQWQLVNSLKQELHEVIIQYKIVKNCIFN